MLKSLISRTLLGLLVLGAFLPVAMNQAAPAADSLIILHPHSTEFAGHVIDGFKTWYQTETGSSITVTTSEKYSGDCWADVETWNGTNPEADVWWGGGEYYFELARQADLLHPYNVTEDANVTDILGGWHLKDDSGDYAEVVWYAAAMSGFGIIYNKEYLTTEELDIPTTWDDLADPSYFGHISMCDPDLSGSTVAIVKQLLMAMAPSGEITYETDTTDAWELWVQISGNVGTFTTSSSKVPGEVSEGNAGIGLCIDYYARDLMKTDTNIGFNYGGATTVSPDPAGIIKGATNLEPAKKFMDYLIGTAGQTLVGDFRTPANFKADTASHIPKAFTSTGAPNTVDFPIIANYEPWLDSAVHSRAEALFHYWIVEPHTELKEAWEQINTLDDGAEKTDAIATLTKLPSDFNGTFAGLRDLKYKDTNATAAWTDHGKTQFEAAFKEAGGGAVPGFEILIVLITLIVFIPFLRKKK
ncbi:MAG: ABC transporter substrate-binding protein [Candidatus Hodarchaeota archaeon]